TDGNRGAAAAGSRVTAALAQLQAKPAEDEATLPADVRAIFDGQLDGQVVIAWSEYDLDERNHFTTRHAVLTEQRLLTVGGHSGAVEARDLAAIEEAKIVEGLGVDRLTLIVEGKLAAELRYSRKHRRGMTKLHRKLERRLPPKAGEERPPEWLEAVERKAEQSEHCPKCGNLIPGYAEGVCPNCQQTRKILWRLLDVAKPYKGRIRAALALTLLSSALLPLAAPLNKRLIDDALGDGTRAIPTSERLSNLVFWIGVLALFTVVTECVNLFRLRLLTTLGTTVARDLRHKVYAHLHDLSLRYFAKRRTGSLITRVTSDTDRLWDFIVFGSVDLVRAVSLVVLIAAVMFWMNWRLALVAMAPIPLLAGITYYRAQTMQRMFGRLWGYWSRMSAVVGDAVPGVKVVKAFANERREIERFDRRSDEYTVQEQAVNRVWVTLQPTVSGLMRLGGTLVMLVGGYMLITDTTGRMTFGTLWAFHMMLWQFYQPIMELANSNRMVTRAASSAQRVFEVLDTPPEVYSAAAAVTKERVDGRVEFRHVSFSYEGTAPALRDVSFAVEPGEMVGVAGPSGAGKSTMMNLLCRFYDVTDGQILIDGVDVRDYDVKWLRRQVGIVLQEPYLFHGTVADNIRYGNPDAPLDAVIRAARAANAHDFIVGFPDGYDTMVGERGQSLSGGERQRISIARAILHDPRILILDEATSSVDTETEKEIQVALDRLVEGRTTLAIAHRLSTLQAADRLVVLEKGRIAEQGTHAELVDKEDGVYAKLHKTQAEMNATMALR
ncbi:MAG TPA: ABC transporter ATP-binding protein, partial [Tepidisphaeraceae bacterium]|nr:ABC transporter ATP-binding protein [Tepidisphaeraceae bacterium]